LQVRKVDDLNTKVAIYTLGFRHDDEELSSSDMRTSGESMDGPAYLSFDRSSVGTTTTTEKKPKYTDGLNSHSINRRIVRNSGRTSREPELYLIYRDFPPMRDNAE
jgi:hypothetical protein